MIDSAAVKADIKSETSAPVTEEIKDATTAPAVAINSEMATETSDEPKSAKPAKVKKEKKAKKVKSNEPDLSSAMKD